MEHGLRARGRAVCAVLAALITAALTASAASAQPADKYPDRPIKIIVPFAPGGSTDILARVHRQKMPENWGQQVIVETRPGAATVIGTASRREGRARRLHADHRR